MSILAAIRREEKKVKKQLAKLQHDLIGLQSAAKALGKTASRDIARAKKHVLSAKGRAKISKAMKERWAGQGTSKEGCRVIARIPCRTPPVLWIDEITAGPRPHEQTRSAMRLIVLSS